MMAEGIKKDEGNVDVENNGKRAVLGGSALRFSKQKRLIKYGICLVSQVKATYHSGDFLSLSGNLF